MVKLIKKHNKLVKKMKKKIGYIEGKCKDDCLICFHKFQFESKISISIFNSLNGKYHEIYNRDFIIKVEEQFLKKKKNILIDILKDMGVDLLEVNLEKV